MNTKNRFICAMLVLITSIMAGVPIHAQASDEGVVTEDIHYTYDHASRLLDVTHSLNGGTPVVVASNSYDELGRLSGTERGVSPSLSSSYSYNVRSWVTEIGGPLFSEILHYEGPRSGSSPGTTGRFGGDVSSMEWRASGDTGMRSYDFSYDGLGRLTSAVYGEKGTPVPGYGTSYSYDVMGNMLSLLRSGDRAPFQKGIVDNLSLTYEGNRLIRTEDVSVGSSMPGSMDFRDGADQSVEYGYDGNGNMTSDLNRGLTVSYNRGNQPAVVSYQGGTETFSYLPDGTKLSRTVTGSDSSGSTTDYRGNLVYEDGVLKYVLFDGGMVSVGNHGSEYVFFLKDHLGSTRVAARSDGAVAQVNHYYPYGLSYASNAMASRAELHPIGGVSGDVQSGGLETGEEIAPGIDEIGLLPLSGSVAQPYRFSGNELYLSDGLGLYDFKARMYDPALGRFTSVDPLAEKYPGISPYSYCAGNPVNFVDPDGLLFDEFDKNGKKISEIGGDMIDFYHDTMDGDDGIRAVDRSTGASAFINDPNLFSHANDRLKNVSWDDITREFIFGFGPTHSLFTMFDGEKYGPFESLAGDSIYAKKLREASVGNSIEGKGSVDISYRDVNPLRSGFDMWEQMIGRASLSWYTIGEKKLFLLQDSKSNASLFYHIPGVKSRERGSDGFGFGNTYQTYIWIEE